MTDDREARDPEARVMRQARADARRLETAARHTGAYPPGTEIIRPNRSTRLFNLRLTDDQLAELQALARHRHLPTSTMARSWLLQRLDQERQAG